MHAHAHALGALGGRRSARSLMPSPVAHWNPGLGMSVSETAALPALAAWTPTGLSEFPGSLPAIVEDTATTRHRILADLLNWTSGPTSMSVTATDINRHWCLMQLSAGEYTYFDLANWVPGTKTAGVTVTYDASTVTVLVLLGTSTACSVNMVPADGASTTYLGSGLSIAITQITAKQHRCAALSDQIGTADLSNSSSPTQIFVQKANGASPGGNSWGPAIAAIWQPNDAAKTLLTDDADLMTVLDGDFTIVADIWVYAAATAAVPLVTLTADVPTTIGLGTDRKLFATCGTSVIATAALSVGRHQIAARRVAATNTWTLFADEAQAADPTALTPGGATTPSELTLTMRCTGLRETLIDSTAMNNTTTIAVLNALKAAA